MSLPSLNPSGPMGLYADIRQCIVLFFGVLTFLFLSHFDILIFDISLSDILCFDILLFDILFFQHFVPAPFTSHESIKFHFCQNLKNIPPTKSHFKKYQLRNILLHLSETFKQIFSLLYTIWLPSFYLM